MNVGAAPDDRLLAARIPSSTSYSTGCASPASPPSALTVSLESDLEGVLAKRLDFRNLPGKRRGDRPISREISCVRPPSLPFTDSRSLRVLVERVSIAYHARSKGRNGAPRIHADLLDEGRRHGRKRVARLMREHGIVGKHRRRARRTTIPDPAAAARPDLIGRDFTVDPDKINTRWCGDITYIRTWEGWLYLATVIDIASRRVVGWATADHLRIDLVETALRQAVTRRRPPAGVIFHSDRGCQYTSAQFATVATELGVRLSHGRKGQCWDNAVGESFFATIKNELLDDGVWPTRTSAHKAIFEYIEADYNTHRRHSTLGYLSPTAYEATATTPATQAA